MPPPPARPRPPSLLGRFRRSKRGVVAVEFAFIAPVLIALFLGGVELTRYINTMRKLTYLANSIAEMLAQNTSGTVNDDDLLFALDSTMLVFPQVLSDAQAKKVYWRQDISVTGSSVSFTPTVPGCASSCAYAATVAWSAGTLSQRPCSVALTAVPDGAAPTPTTLPTDTFGPGSMIVVDVSYDYTPTVAPRIFGTMKIRRSAYLQPRYVPLVKYAGGGAGLGCPGF